MIVGGKDDRSLRGGNRHVANENVADRAAAIKVRFEIQAVCDIIHAVSLAIHVVDAARHLAADRHATARIAAILAIANDDTRCSASHAPAISVPARFDRNSVIPHIKDAAFDQHIGAAVGVDPVAVEVATDKRDVANRDMIAVDGVDHPEG